MSLTIARTEDLEACHALRRIVFMGEQQVSAEGEWDGPGSIDAGIPHRWMAMRL